MSSSSEGEYKLDYSKALLAKLKALQEKAARLDKARRKQFREVLTTIVGKLQTDPLNWGEPFQHLEYFELTIYLAVYQVLAVHYTVLEQEKVVVIRDIISAHATFWESGSAENP